MEKVSAFLFFNVMGEGKFKLNYKKKENFFFSFRELFGPFLVVSFPEKMIRNCFGGKDEQ